MSFEAILQELQNLTRVVTISNAANLEKHLTEYASDEGRKKVWVLIDGRREIEEIISISGLKQSTVYKILKMLEDSKLIVREHGGSPKRLLDFVPAKWVELIADNGRNQSSVTPSAHDQKEGVQSG